MEPLLQVLNQNVFLKNLFESIPCGVLILDQGRRIRAVNNILEQTFGISRTEALQKRGGEALKCIHAHDDPKGCGFSDACKYCGVRNTALEALAGGRIHRNKAAVQLRIDGKIRDLSLLVSAAPFHHAGESLAIIILEDITELNSLRRRLRTQQSFAGIIGKNSRMKEIFEAIREVTDVNVPVLIQGESGTGKELVASAIHNEGPRVNNPFVPINCSALPEGLLESELFGHVKGAFTGAIRAKRGRFELADNGTLFLDEVADMPKVVQAKLLRVLQEGTFEQVGGEKRLSVDVRLISATNRDLWREVKAGRFRDDLYYRIKVVPINLPPLRERKDDIPLLVDHFLKLDLAKGEKSADISQDAMAMMMDYHWPGNVRELQSAIRFALIKSKGKTLTSEDLPMELRNLAKPPSSQGPPRKLDATRVRAALVQSGGNKAKAARLLGVGRATLYRFLAEFPNVS